jgi:hypothetical protein
MSASGISRRRLMGAVAALDELGTVAQRRQGSLAAD